MNHGIFYKLVNYIKWRLFDLGGLVTAIKLYCANFFSHASIIDETSLVDVSLTSHSGRLDFCYLTIESIGRGSHLPRTLTLWINDDIFLENLPPKLKRLQARGLTIRVAENFGPHTKYFPYVIHNRIEVPLVTADDDILYPRGWLEALVVAHTEDPTVVICHRAHQISMLADKEALAPYSEWTACTTTTPSFLNFATGVSGVLYPLQVLFELKSNGQAFQSVCPKADDIWLHVIALRCGFQIKQLTTKSKHFPVIPGSQKIGLVNQNVLNQKNDAQIAKTYTSPDLEKMLFVYKAKSS